VADAIVGNRWRLGGHGRPTVGGGAARLWGRRLGYHRAAGRSRGGRLLEEDTEMTDGDDSVSDSEMVWWDAWIYWISIDVEILDYNIQHMVC
jgi:hypothetical protein